MKRLDVARFVLIWFALSVGVAIASPWVKPQALQLVCSGASSMLLATDSDDGSAPGSSPRLECPACLFFDAPAAEISVPVFATVEPAVFARRPLAADPVAFASAAPLPARGPPLTI